MSYSIRTRIAIPARHLIDTCKSREILRLTRLIEDKQAREESFDQLLVAGNAASELPDRLIRTKSLQFMVPVILVAIIATTLILWPYSGTAA